METRAGPAHPSSHPPGLTPTSPNPQHQDILDSQREKGGGLIGGPACLCSVGAQHSPPDTGWWAGRRLVLFTFKIFPEQLCALRLLPTWL